MDIVDINELSRSEGKLISYCSFFLRNKLNLIPNYIRNR